ncbi:MAG: DUF3179 domain-containing protein [Bacteroidota bacterium]
MKYNILIILMLTLSLQSCLDQPEIDTSSIDGEWSIPVNEVFDGGPGRDGIPAIDNPQLLPNSEVNTITDDQLVIGYFDGTTAVAYPHDILDWHEIVNQDLNDQSFAVTYCPLTGTGIGWNRMINGAKTTFGVSGLLYNTNLIPFDRSTDSNWSQMLLASVNGELRDEDVEIVPMIETTWSTWLSMYPETLVLSRNTGFDRSYGVYPYGDYLSNDDNLLFPISVDDDRLRRKERVHGVIIDGQAKVYRLESFFQETTITDEFKGQKLLIVGSAERNFINSFYLNDEQAENLSFQIVTNGEGLLTDNEGNIWNIFGNAISGPRAGQQLENTTSYMGFWFAWGTFYPDAEIFR